MVLVKPSITNIYLRQSLVYFTTDTDKTSLDKNFMERKLANTTAGRTALTLPQKVLL